jgi:CelD/BcsL family acetyltransferase involved in cellulose biosynthesis
MNGQMNDVRLEIAGPEGAEAHLPAWQALAEQAEEANAFLSPWLLLPAARAFGRGRTLRLLFFYAPHPTHKAQPDLLVGFFALEERRSGVGLPVPVISTFNHPALHLATPLVRAGYTRAVVERLLAYLDDGRRVITLRQLRGDGPFHRALVDGLNARRWLHVGLLRTTRALLSPADSAEAYLARALAGKRRKELRRQHDRLDEQGGLSVETLAADEDPGPWLEDFLRLEAAGWKGREGEPMDGSTATRQFFHEAMREGHRQGRLHLMALRLAGRQIALKVNLLAGDGAFAFKIAFDEAWARYSPGVQLELENIRWFHEQRLGWMDSCAHHARFMINHLWMDRRPIEMLAFSNGHASTSLMVSLLPAVGWARRAATGAEA